MTSFLKGNYPLDKGSKKPAGKIKASSDLTQQFEVNALARLGGSMCFVMKDNKFMWTGGEGETPSS